MLEHSEATSNQETSFEGGMEPQESTYLKDSYRPCRLHVPGASLRNGQAGNQGQKQDHVKTKVEDGPGPDPECDREQPYQDAQGSEGLCRGGSTLAPGRRRPCQQESEDQNGRDHRLGCSRGWMAVAAYQQAEMDRHQYEEHRDLHEQETSHRPVRAESVRPSVV